MEADIEEYFLAQGWCKGDVSIWLDARDEYTDCCQADNIVFNNAWRTLVLIPEVRGHNMAAILLVNDTVAKTTEQISKLYERAIKEHIVYKIANSAWFNSVTTLQAQLLSDAIEIVDDGKVYDITRITWKILWMQYYSKDIHNMYLDIMHKNCKHHNDIEAQKIRINNQYEMEVKIKKILEYYHVENWEFMIDNSMTQYMLSYGRREIEAVRRRSKLGELSLIEAIRFNTSRSLCKRHKKYESIQSLCEYGDILSEKDTLRTISLCDILTQEERVRVDNFCWLPTSLSSHTPQMDAVVCKIESTGLLKLETGHILHKMRDHDYLYYKVPLKTNIANMYMKLKIVEAKQDHYLTHFVEVGNYKSLEEYFTINYDRFIKIGIKRKGLIAKTKYADYQQLVNWSNQHGIILKDMIYWVIKYRHKNFEHTCKIPRKILSGILNVIYQNKGIVL